MKPPRSTIKYENIPNELIELPNWIVWRWEQRDGKWTKPPYQINNKPAHSDKPNTWTDFQMAFEAFHSHDMWDGIGFMIAKGGGYTGFDWDDCLTEDGVIAPDTHEILKTINSYTEISPSGRGLKTLIRGKLPKTGHHNKTIGVFDFNRYFCITGQMVNGFSRNIEPRQAALNDFIRKFWPSDLLESKPKTALMPIPASDQELIEKALVANDGGKFRRLWNGDSSGYDSTSEADLALCTKISFWVGRDSSRIDAIFRSSGLMREKWERQDYREKTISRAIDRTSDTYTHPNITSHNKSVTKHNKAPECTLRNYDGEKIGPTEAINNFIENCSSREFSFRDCCAHVKSLCGANEPSVRTILCRMAKQRKRIAPHDNSGYYRIISCEVKLMDLANAKSQIADIVLPLGLNQLVDIKAGQVILVAGVTNTGKTSFMLDLLANNMAKWRVRYINSEMDAAEFRDVLDLYRGVKNFNEWKFEPVRLERHMHPADLIMPGYGNLNIIDYLEPPEAKFASDWVSQIHDRLDGAVSCISVQRVKGREFGHGGAMLNSRPRLVLNLDWGKCTIAKVKFWKNREKGYNPNGMFFEWTMEDGWRPKKTSKLMNTQEKYAV
jgi:putative DNA primase/helicase